VFPFIVAMSMGDLLHGKPVSAGIYFDSCSAQGHNKRDTPYNFII